MRESKVTVKIPRPLYRKIQLVIEQSGFSSPTDFVVFVLRDLLGEAERKPTIAAVKAVAAEAPAVGEISDVAEDFTAQDLETVKHKLKNLGYL
jgi:Arc/MetJ-type ribon-helix-helix transcriptional regulator